MNDTATATALMLEGNLRAFAAHVSTPDDVIDAPRMAELYAYAAECVKRVPELEAEVERLRAKAEIMADGLAEMLEIVNCSEGVRGLNATENDEWTEFYSGGILVKFDAACDAAEAFEKEYAAATREGADG